MGNFYAKASFEAAQRLETMGREGNLDHAEEACKTLERELERLRRTLVSLSH